MITVASCTSVQRRPSTTTTITKETSALDSNLPPPLQKTAKPIKTLP